MEYMEVTDDRRDGEITYHEKSCYEESCYEKENDQKWAQIIQDYEVRKIIQDYDVEKNFQDFKMRQIIQDHEMGKDNEKIDPNYPSWEHEGWRDLWDDYAAGL